ncbi:MAG: hypothetical protein WCK05_13320 [Planctomycetota bacterium]|jgi:hypothetical protein
MKSERRHELKQNTLDAELVKAYGFFRTHGKLVAWAVLGIAAVGLGYVLIQRHGQNKDRVAQEDFSALVLGGKLTKDTLVRLDAIIDDDANDFRAAYACVAAGDMLINSVISGGAAMTVQERAEAIAKGKTYYAKAVERFPDQPGAGAKAWLGMAAAMAQEKGLAAAREPLEQAAKSKAKAVAGVLAQRTVQEWDGLVSQGAMRQSPLTPAATQPTSLPASQPGSLLPQGSGPEASPETPATAPK